MARTKKNSNGSSAATVGFEQKLWAAADALRNNMDAAEYKHVVLGLIFLPLFKRQQASAAEADTLAALRDTLLPKLIPGELRTKADLPTRINSWR